MVFSDTTNRLGIIELLEDWTDTQSASSGSYPLATKTRDINLAFDDYMALSTPSSGTWQADDSNHTRYPNMKFNLVSGQQDYNFTVDEQGNKVRDIYRVECKDNNGKWQLLTAYNELDEETALSQQETETGIPTRYYKTANGIFLDKTPNYNSTLGIRMYYSRTPDYFLTSDTTKVAGIPNDHHIYLALKPAYWYWLPKDSQRASLYANEIVKMEKTIEDFYSMRTMDERPRLVVKQESNR
jgi:hypothetical protein